MMKTIKFVLFLCCLLTCFNFDLKATHIVGGDMTYQKVGNNKFLITLNLRRDCFLGASNAEFDDPALIGIFRAGILVKSIEIPYAKDDTLNNFVQSDCGFEGTQVCVHETQYKTLVDLSFFEGGYTIAYQRCCRNGSINNIVDPLLTGATYSVHIPREAFEQQNSTPYFKRWPEVYICGGKPLSFDNSAIDPDGDSLVYKLCNPKIGLTRENPKAITESQISVPPYTDLQWQAPYSLSNLMGGTPLMINPKTGLMTAVPLPIEGQYVIGVCVEEWRNGKKIGEIRRDFQYNVRICSTPPTAIFEAPSLLCNEKTVTFNNTSLASQKYDWNFNYPSTDPAFQSTVKSPTFTFPANGTYQVKLTVTRNSDNCKDEEIKTIRITDLPYNADFIYEIQSCNADGTVTVILTDKSTTADVGITSNKWDWKLTQGSTILTASTNPAVFKIKPQDFAVSLDVGATNGCKGAISKNLNYEDKVFESDFKIELAGCESDNLMSIKLIDLSQDLNDNYTIDERKWIISSGGNQYSAFGNNVSISIPRQNFEVALDVTTTNTCRNQLSKTFLASQFIPTIGYDFVLSGCDVQNNAIISLKETSNDSVLYSQVNQYIWNVDGTTLNGQAVSYIGNLRDTVNCTLTLQFGQGCKTQLSKTINIEQLRPKLDFKYTPIDCPSDDKVNIGFEYINTGNQGLGNDGITWKIGKPNATSDYTGNDVVVTFTKNEPITASIKTKFANGCIDEVAKPINVGPFATLKILNDSLTLCPGQDTALIVPGNPIFNYSWTPSTGINTTNPANPILTATSDATYNLVVSDGLCSVSGKVVVNVLESLTLAIEGNKITCDGGVDLLGKGGFGIGKYQWSDNPAFSTILGEKETLATAFTGREKTYYLRYVGEFCSAIPATINVVNQTPEVEAVPNPICKKDTIKTNILFNAISSHNNKYEWKPNPHIVSGQNIINPVITAFATDTKFTLVFTATNQHGCSLTDSVTFDVQNNPTVLPIAKVEDCNTLKVCVDYTITGTQYGFPKWEFGDGNDAISKSSCNVYGKEGEYVIKLSNLSDVCPFETKELKIKLNKTIPLFSNSEDTECINTSYQLTLPAAAQNLQYTWKDTKGNVISTAPNPKVDIKSDTSFVLNVLDANGCPFNDTFYVDAFKFSAKKNVPDVFCQATEVKPSIEVTPSGINYQYTWLPASAIVSGGTTASPTVTVDGNTVLSVLVKHPTLGCEYRDTVKISATQVDVSVKADPVGPYVKGQPVTVSIVNPNSALTYTWSNGFVGTVQTFNIQKDTLFKITVSDVNGCTAETEIRLDVRPPQCAEDVFVPTAFSPNGDGTNDIFFVRSNYITELELIIFNRWGQEVFSTTNIKDGWDGMLNGEELAPDVYAYWYRAKCSDGEEQIKRGNISLLR